MKPTPYPKDNPFVLLLALPFQILGACIMFLLLGVVFAAELLTTKRSHHETK